MDSHTTANMYRKWTIKIFRYARNILIVDTQQGIYVFIYERGGGREWRNSAALKFLLLVE